MTRPDHLQAEQSEEAERLIHELQCIGNGLGAISRAREFLKRDGLMISSRQIKTLEKALRSEEAHVKRIREAGQRLVRDLEDDLRRLEGRPHWKQKLKPPFTCHRMDVPRRIKRPPYRIGTAGALVIAAGLAGVMLWLR